MLTKNQVMEFVKNGKESDCMDNRDYYRLADFFEESEHSVFGVKLNEDCKSSFKPKDWNLDNIISDLKRDVDFGFEKALNKRGISASLMSDVVYMWLWILEDDLQNFDDYPEYSLPLFKSVAVKYGFDNPIGDDYGNEFKYSAEADY